MGELDGQVAIVTGGSRGVGRGITDALAAQGAAVMIAARSRDELTTTRDEVRAAGGTVECCVADVEDPASVQALLEHTERVLGPVSLLVNNAGGTGTSTGPFETLDPWSMKRTLDNNLWTAMLCSRLVVPGMLEGGGGRIINVASGGGLVGLPYVNAYSVAKTGVIRFTEGLAMELEDRGVKAFSITPGMVRTTITEGGWQARKMAVSGWLERFHAPPRENLALDEVWMPPSRVGSLCCYLASGSADTLTGCYFSAYDDERRMTAAVDEVRAKDLYRLRLHSLDGVERAVTPAQLQAAREANP